LKNLDELGSSGIWQVIITFAPLTGDTVCMECKHLPERSMFFLRLIMESGLLIDQDLDEGLEQSFSAFLDVVSKLEEPQIQREPFLGYATMASEP